MFEYAKLSKVYSDFEKTAQKKNKQQFVETTRTKKH
jgi:hypothetical protein